MFANTICLVLGFTTSLIGLWHVEQRRILSRGLRESFCDDMLRFLLSSSFSQYNFQEDSFSSFGPIHLSWI
ncbi:uncharacterized protein EI90DRAFT_67146 [Cantharellus anzutake]|uniref:uncharacterized protein n=1 Tax=Cantharellus anzutake TaxID=1750568 RepID=UPI001908CBE1|nr:uncharacterized protein EI90DRAFT_67146 [Cantharellus anzutake]KAF8344313.1 hypothetical protein EI90DRAFT_67146 [Cantharellus anzutake]